MKNTMKKPLLTLATLFPLLLCFAAQAQNHPTAPATWQPINADSSVPGITIYLDTESIQPDTANPSLIHYALINNIPDDPAHKIPPHSQYITGTIDCKNQQFKPGIVELYPLHNKGGQLLRRVELPNLEMKPITAQFPIIQAIQQHICQ